MADRRSFDLSDEKARREKKASESGPEQEPRIHPLVALQAHVGNRTVARLIAGVSGGGLLIQGAVPARRGPSIAQRQEMPEEEELAQAKHDPAAAQRQATPEEEEEPIQAKHDLAAAQRQAAPEEEEELAQTKRDGALAQRSAGASIGLEGGPLDDQMASRIDAARGTGAGLGEGLRNSMESSFGVDFGAVRVHQDSGADNLARAMTAKAFTTGSDIFLRADQNANDGSLMAHELTHVVQQASGATGGPQGLTVGAADDPYEHEADQVANAVTAGAEAPLRKPEEPGSA